jgi:membrane associated rhomboid family serine protease
MQRCEECGEDVSMPYTCSFCGKKFCSEHRLPENHSCDGLASYERDVRDRGKVYEGPSPETSKSGGGRSLPIPSLNGNATYYLLGIMAAVYVLQRIVILTTSPEVHHSIFVLNPGNLEYVWTWVTSIFAHGNLPHLLINGLVLFFFGSLLERKIGTDRYLALFFVAGIVAGLSQGVATLVTVDSLTLRDGALGASGAIAAVLGTLTVLNPNLRVYLWFFIPMPLWVLTIGFAAYDIFFAATGGVGAGGVARLAHLSGLALGLAYGWKLKQEGVAVRDRLNFGGGPGGPGGPGRGRI